MRIRIGKYNSSAIEKGYRFIKSFIRSERDVQTSHQVSPWGEDSQPAGKVDVVHAETATDETTLIVGVVQKNKKAGPGEKRIFATDESGNEIVDIFMRNDGTIEIAGTGDNLVKFIPLDQGLQDFKNEIQAELVKIQTGITGAGGAYTPGTLTVDISDSKVDKLKTT